MNSSNAKFDKKVIFISRELSALSPILLALSPLGYTVIHQSLIQISQIRFTHTPNAQWVFFTSKNAVHHFFAQQPFLKPTTKFGVMSKASADYLLEFGKTAHFIGEGVDVSQIAKNFANHIKDETVLLPQAIDSLQSIQKHLSFTNNCTNLYVYKTTRKPDFEIPFADILVFTSPSNVEAYFSKYKIADSQKVIAIGSTTANSLKNFGVKEILMPNTFDEKGMLEVISNCIEGELSISK
jgi:uroporphyrinogen-III synthase